LFIFIGFRGFIYTDWVGYVPIYNKAPSLFDGLDTVNNFITNSRYSSLEHGFLMYVVICKTFSENYFFLQSISCIIDICIIYYFFKKYIPNNIILGFVCFFLFNGFSIEVNLLRNSKAIMIFLLSIKYIEERKIIKYIIMILFASLFHVSALLYLPLFWILNKKWSKRLILVLFIIGNIVFFLSIKWISGILISFSGIFDLRLSVLIQSYTQSIHGFGLTTAYFERFLSFCMVYVFYERLINKSKSNIIFINSFLIYSFIFLYCNEIYVLPQRLPLLLTFSYWILYPQVYSMLSRKNKYIFIFLLLSYGSLRLLQDNRIINAKYENVLFKYSSYSQRESLMRKAMQVYGEMAGNRFGAN
jgi:hypothetical protein